MKVKELRKIIREEIEKNGKPHKRIDGLGERKRKLKEGFATHEGRKIDRIVQWLGYDDFHEFIGDNPGCYEAVVNWIDMEFGDQLATEYIDPNELEAVGLYDSADRAKRHPGND